MGIPVGPPVGTVRYCPVLYPNPVFETDKSIISDPNPTTISIFAWVPIPNDGVASPDCW